MSNQTQLRRFPSRKVLDGVPKVGYNVRLCPFPGSLEACLAYLNDPCDYDYIMGVTGAAFRRLFNKEDGGNIDLMHLGLQPAANIFSALGYGYQTVPRDKPAMVRAVLESINAGRPVIAFGIIGPPEAGIVAGYDRHGETLYGYSYFQDASIEGYYESSDWFETIAPGDCCGLIVIGDKRKRKPSKREVLVKSLEWAIDLARTPKRLDLPDHASGLAAYDAWADGLEEDADFPSRDKETMGWRLMIHGDQCVMQEERRSAARFLRQVCKVAPEAAAELESAAKLYDQAADQGRKTWPWETCDYGDPSLIRGLADRATRESIAKGVRAAKAREARAVGHLEKALSILKRKAGV